MSFHDRQAGNRPPESKPLLKREYIQIPLSIPAEWDDFFDRKAETLEMSRNAVLCLTLKLGGPILEASVNAIREQLWQQYARIDLSSRAVHAPSEILGPSPFTKAAVSGRDERRKSDANAGSNPGDGQATVPGSGKEGQGHPSEG